MARRTCPLLVAPVLALVLLAGCGGGGGGGGTSKSATLRAGETPGATVLVKSLKFDPAKVSVKKGQVVVWQYRDGSVAHNVRGGDLKGPTQSTGDWAFRFDKAGTYSYKCSIHPFMKGTVTVG